MPRAFKVIDNYAALLLLLLLVFLPVYGPYMVKIEGGIFPVTSKVTIVEQHPVDGGLDIRFVYSKIRTCELVGTSLQIGGQEIGFDPVLNGISSPPTRLPGQQVSRLWHVATPTLKGAEMWFVHRCHFLWLTATQVLPNDANDCKSAHPDPTMVCPVGTGADKFAL